MSESSAGTDREEVLESCGGDLILRPWQVPSKRVLITNMPWELNTTRDQHVDTHFNKHHELTHFYFNHYFFINLRIILLHNRDFVVWLNLEINCLSVYLVWWLLIYICKRVLLEQIIYSEFYDLLLTYKVYQVD